MNRYQEGKERARAEAINWQLDTINQSMSWGELNKIQVYFERKAKQFGLVKEFKENCII